MGPTGSADFVVIVVEARKALFHFAFALLIMPAAKVRRVSSNASSTVADDATAASPTPRSNEVENPQPLMEKPGLPAVLLADFRASMSDVLFIVRLLACSLVSRTAKGACYMAVYFMDQSDRKFVKLWGTYDSLLRRRAELTPGKIAFVQKPNIDSWGLKLGRGGSLLLAADACRLSPSEEPPAENLLEDSLHQCCTMNDDSRVELHVYILSVDEPLRSQKNTLYVQGRFQDEEKRVLNFIAFGGFAENSIIESGSFYYFYNAKISESRIMLLSETGFVTDVPTFDVSPPLIYV